MCKGECRVEKKAFDTGYKLAQQHYGSKWQDEVEKSASLVEKCARLEREQQLSEDDWSEFVKEQCEGYHLKIQDLEHQIKAFKLGPSHWLDGSSLRTVSCQQTETYFAGKTACEYHLRQAFFARFPNEYLHIMHWFS